MESVSELLRLLVQALALFATSLDRWFKIPWPVPIAMVFVPVVAALDIVVWYLRGTTFPVSCGYIKVGEKGRCRRLTLGEWHKCWYHSKIRLRKTDRHLVDPNMRRWQSGLNDANPQTGAITGRGFLSMRSRRDTLLYHQGFARPREDVLKLIPEVFSDYKHRAKERWANLRSLGLRGLIPLTERGNRQVATSHLLPGVIQATRLTLLLVAIGLLLVIISIPVPTAISVIFEYLATFSLIIAFTVTRTGIWRAEPKWLRPSLTGAAKWIAWLTGLATLSGLLGLFADDVRNVVRTIVETVFTGLVALVVISLGYILFFKKKTRRSRRKRIL